MPPDYAVRSRVVDLRSDSPRATDRLLLDTNVWAWMGYFRSGIAASGVRISQVAVYAPYFKRLLLAGATLCRSGLSFAELSRLIELNELEGYATAAGPLSLKEYRHNITSERTRVVGEIQRVWKLIEQDSEDLPLTLDAAATNATSARLGSAELDGHDFLLLAAMEASGVTQILTDDGDFCTVSGIEVFTANVRVIAAARTQGQLVVR